MGFSDSSFQIRSSPINKVMCGSRNYPYPHHGGNWKFQRGGRSMAQEIPEGRSGESLDKFLEGQLHVHVRHSCSKL